MLESIIIAVVSGIVTDFFSGKVAKSQGNTHSNIKDLVSNAGIRALKKIMGK